MQSFRRVRKKKDTKRKVTEIMLIKEREIFAPFTFFSWGVV